MPVSRRSAYHNPIEVENGGDVQDVVGALDPLDFHGGGYPFA